MASTTLTVYGNTSASVNYPGVAFNPNEVTIPSPVYFEDREISGTLYRVRNAAFDGTNWNLQTTGQKVYALAQYPNGQLVYLEPPAGMTSWANTAWLLKGTDGVFNVLDFGAVTDGTDTSVAINAAATAASNAGGGVVYCPSGTYTIKEMILLDNNTTLRGDNTGATTFFAHASLNNLMSSIMVANTMYNGNHSLPVQHNISVRYITFDGNAINNQAGMKMGDDSAIDFRGVDYVTIEACTVKDVFNNAISVVLNPNFSAHARGFVRILNNNIDVLPTRMNDASGKYSLVTGNLSIRVQSMDNVLIHGNIIGFNNTTWANDAIDTPNSSNVTITNNQIAWATDGIGIETSTNYVIANNIVTNCIGYGIRSFQGTGEGTSATSFLIISNNVVTGVPVNQMVTSLGPTQVGIHVDSGQTGSDDCVVSNNMLLGPFMASGISLQATQGSCIDNVIDLNGKTMPYASNGIEIDNNDWVVSGNTIRNGATGINIGNVSGIKFLVVTDNNIKNCTTLFQIAGSLPTSSRICDNVGFNPPPPSTITQPPISTSLTTNTTPFHCTVYITPSSGASISQIQVNGLTVVSTNLTTPISVRVSATGTIKVTYSGSVSWVWIPE